RCLACNWYCRISKGQTGICGVRKNSDGELTLLVYGRPTGLTVDPVEKKPLFHFLPRYQKAPHCQGEDEWLHGAFGTGFRTLNKETPTFVGESSPESRILSFGTVGCNFSCEFCQNYSSGLTQIKSMTQKETSDPAAQTQLIEEIISSFPKRPPEKIVKYALKNDIPAIAFTYNEPAIFFEYAYDVAILARKNNLKTVFVSNGFESKEALKKIGPYLDAINIDLKSFRQDFYEKICHAKLSPVLENIKRVYKMGIWLEITTLVIPGHNDSEEELTEIAEFIYSVSPSIPWHISAFYPAYKMENVSPTPVATLLKAYGIGKKAGLEFVYVGNADIPDKESTFCPKCGVLLIRRRFYKTEILADFDKKRGLCLNCGKKIAGVWRG
ncbi:MAG: AmmeMemoRadiSam system radical SAM enzyme, partial [bacterium]|nr:AmmeMemoRadiSam system radical SAM enzyme [bacterium]